MSFTQEDAADVLNANRREINRLRLTTTNIMTVHHLKFYLDWLDQNKLEGDATTISLPSVFEIEAMTTAFVVSYGRMFSSTKGVTKYLRKSVSQEHIDAHDEIISLRNERYAHHGDHESYGVELDLTVFEDRVETGIHYLSQSHVGAPQSWRNLINWLEVYVKESFNNQLSHLSNKTMKTWHQFDPELVIKGAKLFGADEPVDFRDVYPGSRN